MTSVCSFLYMLVLFSELSSHLVTVAVPASKLEDSVADQVGLGLILGDEPMTESAVYGRSHVLDNSVRDEDRRPKITVISDVRLKGIRGLTPAFVRSPPPLAGRSLSNVPAEHSLNMDRRNIDLDMLRCMVGRVYRPCWEVEP